MIVIVLVIVLMTRMVVLMTSMVVLVACVIVLVACVIVLVACMIVFVACVVVLVSCVVVLVACVIVLVACVIVAVAVVVAVAVSVVVVIMVVVGVRVTSTAMSGAFLASSVDVTPLTRVKDLDLNQVEDERHAGNCQHDCATDFVTSVDQSLSCFVEQPDRHDPDREDRTESANDFHSMVTKCEAFIRLPVGNLQRADRNAESNYIRGDVRSVRHDGDRMCHYTTGDLNCNENERSHEHEQELLSRFSVTLHRL